MLYELTLSALTAKLAAGEVSAREAMQACLDRIDAVDDRVNAFISLDRDDALGQAEWQALKTIQMVLKVEQFSVVQVLLLMLLVPWKLHSLIFHPLQKISLQLGAIIVYMWRKRYTMFQQKPELKCSTSIVTMTTKIHLEVKALVLGGNSDMALAYHLLLHSMGKN